MDSWPESGVTPIDKIVNGVEDNVDSKPSVLVLASSPDIPAYRHAFLTPAELKKENIGVGMNFVSHVVYLSATIFVSVLSVRLE
jgi:hypothetical protein